MRSVEHDDSRNNRKVVRDFAGDMFYKFWHGYTKNEGKQFDFWAETSQLIKIDGLAHDRDWIKKRESQLNKLGNNKESASSVSIWAYGRARLEDYCRHQGKLEDGRVVARVPVYGTSREQLAKAGILADTFIHENPTETSGQNFTVILPHGWTLRPEQTQPEDGDMSTLQLADQRWAGVYDQNDSKVVSVFYSSKPYDSYDNFRSLTRVEPAPQIESGT